MDRGAWQAAVHGIAKSWIRLSDFTFTFTLKEHIFNITFEVLECFSFYEIIRVHFKKCVYLGK